MTKDAETARTVRAPEPRVWAQHVGRLAGHRVPSNVLSTCAHFSLYVLGKMLLRYLKN